MMGPGYGMGYGMGGGIWMMLGFLLIIVFVIYYFMKTKNTGNNGFNASPQVPEQNAMEIAKIRFAKGEITAEEFEDIKKILS